MSTYAFRIPFVFPSRKTWTVCIVFQASPVQVTSFEGRERELCNMFCRSFLSPKCDRVRPIILRGQASRSIILPYLNISLSTNCRHSLTRPFPTPPFKISDLTPHSPSFLPPEGHQKSEGKGGGTYPPLPLNGRATEMR